MTLQRAFDRVVPAHPIAQRNSSSSAKPDATPPALLRELIAGLALVGLPHGFNLAVAPVACYYLVLLYRHRAIARPRLLPRKSTLFALTLAVIAMVWLSSGGIFGKTAGTGLLLAGSGLKLLELRSRRDVYLAVALAYTLALTQLLFSQSIPMAVYLLAVVIHLTAVLIGMHCGEAPVPFARRLRQSGMLALQGLPLAALLFVLAPRLPGPIWSLADEKGAKSGLSDRLEPGGISRLSLSDDLAFRVDFEGPPPPLSRLYWRGPVFWWTDGRRWDMHELPPLETLETDYAGEPVDYSIVLEPHGHKWLLGLDLPQRFPRDGRLTGDFQLVAKDDVRDRRLYRLRSYPTYRYRKLAKEEKRLGLQLPKDFSPPLAALVATWRQGGDDPAVIRQALAYFHDNGFRYTLQPPELPDRPVERFLLETRQGFCEHYATSFVVLMRLAGIPARVVTGYLGGQWNAMGQFLEIRQSDAHAWAEVWLEGSGWVRVDPTAAVAPERIDKPAVEAAASAALPSDRLGMTARQTAVPWVRTLGLFLDSVNHGWHRWVLGYDRDMRERLLQWLGAEHWMGLLRWLSLAMACAAVPFLWLFWHDARVANADPALHHYRRFCAQLAAIGLPRKPGEAPSVYASRIADRRPRLAKDVVEITDAYIRLRYGDVADSTLLKRLKGGIGRLL